MTDTNPDTPQFPMRVVVRRTGLTASLLRAWERRYGAVEPGRSEGGQRLYSEENVRRLVLLKELVDRGHNIGQIAGRETPDLRALLRQDARTGPALLSAPEAAPGAGDPARSSGDPALPYVDACLAAISDLQPSALAGSLRRAAMALDPATLVDGVLVPLLNRIGLLWSEGRIPVATEHLASTVVRSFLEELLTTLVPGEAVGVAVTGMPTGHRHEFGGLLASVVLAGEGWKVWSLGGDLPAGEIADAARRVDADLVALSALYPDDDPRLLKEVQQIRRQVGERVALVIGGPAAARIADAVRDEGVWYLPDLPALRRLGAELARVEARR